MHIRSILLGASAPLALLATIDTAQAQDAAPAVAAADSTADSGEDIVVTGTRVAGRSRLETASPVDVLSSNSLRQQGTTELAQALANVAPSISFARPAATDATDAIRPATLRGLSPDQTLVLINGVRTNASASLNVNGTVGRGAAAVDLNTVPTVALDRIEVLRDGASAQYGSDAIAGVINLRLREARGGGAASVTYGFYDTEVETARARRNVKGESTVTVAGWQGVGLGQDGFLTLSGEYVQRNPTNRADAPAANAPTGASGVALQGRFGDPEVEQYTLFANAGVPLGDVWRLYGWGGVQQRDTASAAFPRPNNAGAVQYLAAVGYPNGFLPLIDTRSQNVTSAVGVKGEIGGWGVDLTVGYGRNKVRFRTENSANFSYGAASPKSFYDGAVIYDQWTAGLDVSKRYDVLGSLNVAWGLEGRREGYEIQPGEPASYSAPATGAVAGAPSIAQGFAGFSPLNQIKRSRRSGSAYLDLEAQLTDAFLIGVAARGESYSDFGEIATGKVSARYDLTRGIALRGTVSTGFRAPSLQQQYFTSISSVLVGGNIIETGTFPSNDPRVANLGARALRPEKSTNFSAGTVLRFGGFDVTVDGYLIRLRDQIALSENIPVTTLPNISAARFFINGLRSTTKGIDVVAHYRLPTQGAGTFDLTVAGNVNDVSLTTRPSTALFGRNRVLTLEEGTPREKVAGTIDWSDGALGATLRATYYGDVTQPGTTAAGDAHTGRHTITDAELRYRATRGAEVALGVNNLFDIYPDRYPGTLNAPSGVVGFPYYSPFGFNGRYIYARAGLNW
ncbi:TonB-dependent receptor plug domain-containing protein [Sphingomonas adhaesiva]|uniref:TonB-dependent receptor plug domain-containing protein n=1 Tax=Sphingomonas adhaesiva TaxID=28212 RepID=UPI002FFAA640